MELLENLLIPTMKKSSSRQFSFVKRFGKNTLTTLTLSVPIPNEEKKLNSIFIFTFLGGASKGFITAFFPHSD